MIVLQILSLMVWLLAVPFCIGLLPGRLMKKELRTPGILWIAGYIILFVLLELVGIPIVLSVDYHGFTIFSRWFAAVLLLFATAGVYMVVRGRESGNGVCLNYKETWRASSQEEKIMLFLFLVLVGIQLYMAFTRASFDGDDAYYGVQALTAQQIDVLYRIDPNNGRSSTLDVRHGLALFPIWEAFIGKMSGIHATIICHSVIPLVLIPLTYVLYYQIGRVLFQKRKDLLPMFMVIIALWQMFGNVSIYTTETFFLTRTWQGKSFAGNFVIPAVLWIFLRLFVTEETEKAKVQSECPDSKSMDAESPDAKNTDAGYTNVESPDTGSTDAGNIGLWILLGCLNLAGGASSSLAVLLSVLLTAGLAVLFAIREKKFSIVVKAGFTCVPGGMYILLYLLLTHGFIRL